MAKEPVYYANEKPGVDFPKDDPNSRSLTNQSDKDSTDINLIMARYEKTGLIPDVLTGNGRTPMYGDFTSIGDYHQMQSAIARANQFFAALPAKVRSRFKNDPAELIEFAGKKENQKELVELGLMTSEEFSALNPAPVEPEKSPVPAPAGPGQPANPAA